MADLPSDIQYTETSALNVEGSWVVKKFSELPGSCIQSEYFKHGENMAWRLELHPGEILNRTNCGHAMCFINFGSVPKSNLNVKVRLSLMDTLNRPISPSCRWDYESPTLIRSYKCGVFGQRTELQKKLVDDILVISIDVCFSPLNIATLGVTNRIQNDSEPSEKLIHDYISLWKSGRDSDIILIANGMPIRAHSLILSTRSSTFAKKIRYSRLIGSNHTEIVGFDEDTVRLLLQFIYSSTVDDMDNKKALDLLRAAEEYEMIDLKTYCSGFLMCNFSVGNICEVIIAADKYDDKILKEKAIEYFCKNRKVIDLNNCFPALKERPEVLCEILKGIK